MASTKELNIGSLTTAPIDRIPFFSLVKTQSLNGGIKEVHAVLDDNNRNPETLVSITRHTFGVEIKLEQVNVTNYIPDERDALFAKEFGFTIIPIAYAALKGESVEAWIGPTLVPVGHPLYHGTEKDNQIHVVFKDSEKQDGEKGFSYYIRLKVKDQFGVLAKIAEKFGDANISIKEMRQPPAEEGGDEVDMIFLLYPCQTQVLQSTLSAIAELSDIVTSVNVPFRIFDESK